MDDRITHDQGATAYGSLRHHNGLPEAYSVMLARRCRPDAIKELGGAGNGKVLSAGSGGDGIGEVTADQAAPQRGGMTVFS